MPYFSLRAHRAAIDSLRSPKSIPSLLLTACTAQEEEDAFAEEVVDAAQELDDNALLKMKRAAAVTNVDYWTGDFSVLI